jgi:anaerobic magnesium-protoporphyrin IX monomethyl ester cyclase
MVTPPPGEVKSVKILLATPPLSMEDRYGSLVGAGSEAPTLGLLQLAAVTKQHGYPTELLDAVAQGTSKAEFLEFLLKAAPDVLALSSTTLAITNAAQVAAEAKILLPDLRVIVGGPHPSAIPVETMERFPVFDCAAVGEGEETLLAVLKAWAEKTSLEAVAGVVYRAADGNLRQNQRRG